MLVVFCYITESRGTAPLSLIFEHFVHFLKKYSNLDKVSYGSGQKYSKELKSYTGFFKERPLLWKMCENQYFPCFEP